MVWKTSQMDTTQFEINITPCFSSIDPVCTTPAPLDPDVARLWVKVPCDYARRLLVHAIARRRPRLAQVKREEDASILWADYEDLDFDRILAGDGKIKANSYLIRKGLGRKAQLAYQLRKYMAKRPQSVLHGAVPETLVIETWEAFEEEMSFGALGATFDQNLTASLSQRDRLEWCLRDAKERLAQSPDQAWILKPSVTNKGAEVAVLRDYVTMADVVGEWPDVREWVLQAYVARPLLHKRKKFHLRCYVLAVGDLSVYVWRQVLLLSSAMEYDEQDLGNQLAHITNTARQVEDGEPHLVAEEECVFLLDDLVGDLRISRGLKLEEAEGVVEGIRKGMEEVTGELFKALHGERTVFAPLPQCFELLGLDFLVSLDEDKEKDKTSTLMPQVHLLEVNPGPDFKQTGPRLRPVIGGLLEATLDVAVLGDHVEGTDDLVLVYQSLHQQNGGSGMRLLDG